MLIFINPQVKMDIQDSVTDTILHYQDIPSWLLGLIQTKDFISNTKWQVALQKNTLSSFSCHRKLPIEQLIYLKRGIHCRNCGYTHFEEKRYDLECLQCHQHEPKETAYTRTICEFGVLFHHLDFTVNMLYQFFDEHLNIRYLKQILEQHFDVKELAGRYTTYHNKGTLFPYWFEEQLDYFEKIEKRTTWRIRNSEKKVL